MTIGEKIKEIRVSKGMTLEEVAKPIGLTRQRLSKIESGIYSPTIPTIKQVAKGMHCSPLDILTEPLCGDDIPPHDEPCVNSGFCPFYKKEKV